MDLSIDADDVDAVLLDMGGVFTILQPHVVVGALDDAGLALGHDGTDPAPFHRAHYEGIRAYDTSEDAVETFAAFLDAYLASLGVAAPDLGRARQAVEARWSTPASERWTWVLDDSVEALARLARADVPLGVVSNCDGTAEAILLGGGICHVGPGDHVEVVVVVDSGVVGIEKPDPAIFGPAVEALAVAPERTVYVGDSRRNDVAGASAAGLHPVQLDPYDLYGDHDHDRIRSLHELADHLGAP